MVENIRCFDLNLSFKMGDGQFYKYTGDMKFVSKSFVNGSLSIAFLILFFACVNSNNIKSDEVFDQTFNKEEIRGIETLIDYTDSLVRVKTKSKIINSAYHLYFDNLKNNMFDGNFLIPIDDEVKFKYLENINENTISEFWNWDSSVSSKQMDDTERLNININGKFLNYMNKIGGVDTTFKALHNSILGMGDVPTGGLIKYFSNNDNIDFNLIRNRMLAMVCIFSISETGMRKPVK